MFQKKIEVTDVLKWLLIPLAILVGQFLLKKSSQTIKDSVLKYIFEFKKIEPVLVDAEWGSEFLSETCFIKLKNNNLEKCSEILC